MANKKKTAKKDVEIEIEAEVEQEEPTLVDSIELDENGDEIEVGIELDPLEAAQAEVAEMKDKLLRQHAEMENMRKRNQKQVEDAHKFAVEKFATALLDVMDNMERALDVEEGNEAGIREGVQITLDSWTEMMGKFNLERIDAVGEMLDPHKHEALSEMPSEEPKGTVIAQHVAGYTLNGRLIRAAKVLVSSGS